VCDVFAAAFQSAALYDCSVLPEGGKNAVCKLTDMCKKEILQNIIEDDGLSRVMITAGDFNVSEDAPLTCVAAG